MTELRPVPGLSSWKGAVECFSCNTALLVARLTHVVGVEGETVPCQQAVEKVFLRLSLPIRQFTTYWNYVK
jgi:hypothetical protein